MFGPSRKPFPKTWIKKDRSVFAKSCGRYWTDAACTGLCRSTTSVTCSPSTPTLLLTLSIIIDSFFHSEWDQEHADRNQKQANEPEPDLPGLGLDPLRQQHANHERGVQRHERRPLAQGPTAAPFGFEQRLRPVPGAKHWPRIRPTSPTAPSASRQLVH